MSVRVVYVLVSREEDCFYEMFLLSLYSLRKHCPDRKVSLVMDPETYDQVMINKEIIGDNMKFVKENEEVKVVSYNGSVFAIEPPLFVELEVTETEPGFAGNTAQGATKPATVETGATIQVPLFVNIGDKVKIDTRTSEYLSRA